MKSILQFLSAFNAAEDQLMEDWSAKLCDVPFAQFVTIILSLAVYAVCISNGLACFGIIHYPHSAPYSPPLVSSVVHVIIFTPRHIHFIRHSFWRLMN